MVITFFDLLIVTLLTSVTGFIPSFSIALRLFFSLLLCLELSLSPAPWKIQDKSQQHNHKTLYSINSLYNHTQTIIYNRFNQKTISNNTSTEWIKSRKYIIPSTLSSSSSSTSSSPSFTSSTTTSSSFCSIHRWNNRHMTTTRERKGRETNLELHLLFDGFLDLHFFNDGAWHYTFFFFFLRNNPFRQCSGDTLYLFFQWLRRNMMKRA